MIKIYNKELSEETIADAREKALGMTFEKPERKYRFKTGDVVSFDGLKRIICSLKGKNYSFDVYGCCRLERRDEEGWPENYRKIGELKDYIK